MAFQWEEMRMVRWMCGIKLQDTVWSKEDNDWVKKCVKCRVPGQEVDQRKLGQRLCKKTVRHVN